MQAITVVSMLNGCVIPPGLDEQQPAVNHAPVILRDMTQPLPEQTATEDRIPSVGTFEIVRMPVEDEDIGDTLTLRAFVNYDPAVTVVDAESQTIDPTGVPLRTFSVDVPASACDGTPVNTNGDPITVTAVVSDRTFTDNDASDGGLPGLITSGRTDATFWAVLCVAPTK